MDWIHRLPYRLGTTSYILPDEILPNVQYLAGKVRDIELVLFEVDEIQNNLPAEETVSSLLETAGRHDLTYTVHLPLDLRLGEEEGERHPSIVKAQRTIAATRGLSPHAYIVHLDGGEVQGGATPEVFLKWQKQSSLALDMLAEMGGGASMLAVENLEHYPKGFWEQALDGMPGSRCVDIGHLWLDGIDPLPYMQHTGRLTRVIHLHGSDLRDHASLEYVEAIKLDAVMEYLIQTGYGGVVTLEVFSQADFLSSCQSVERSLRRIGYL